MRNLVFTLLDFLILFGIAWAMKKALRIGLIGGARRHVESQKFWLFIALFACLEVIVLIRIISSMRN